jgi:hypothetical protein
MRTKTMTPPPNRNEPLLANQKGDSRPHSPVKNKEV